MAPAVQQMNINTPRMAAARKNILFFMDESSSFSAFQKRY
jgi:hypothetical protein